MDTPLAKLTDIKVFVCSPIVGAPRKADVNKLDNPVWSNPFDNFGPPLGGDYRSVCRTGSVEAMEAIVRMG